MRSYDRMDKRLVQYSRLEFWLFLTIVEGEEEEEEQDGEKEEVGLGNIKNREVRERKVGTFTKTCILVESRNESK